MSWKDPIQEAYWERHGDTIRARRRARYAQQRRSETPEEREDRLDRQRTRCARYRKAHPERARQSSARWREKHMRQWRYGISRDDVEQRLQVQLNQCAICKTALSLATACVDHDHATGRCRGLLCRKCNLGLGHFNDNPAFLRFAQLYLEHHE